MFLFSYIEKKNILAYEINKIRAKPIREKRKSYIGKIKEKNIRENNNY